MNWFSLRRFPGSREAVLVACGLALLAMCLALTVLSSRFDYHTPADQRPLGLFLGLLAAGFALHLFALWAGLRSPQTERTSVLILVFAVLLRLVLLFSNPIQEVDIYRYCWDGAVLRSGVSPFRYPPAQVAQVSADRADLPSDLRTLVQRRDQDAGLSEVLQRVHYAELTTIYPPVSQMVFAVADLLVPSGASLYVRVTVMKLIIVGFDVVTLLILWSLLCQLQLHTAWLIIYGWSPLVLKEFANSGHLDSIAVACTLMGLRAYVRHAQRGNSGHWTSAVWISLGVGAKLFPIVLLPLLSIVAWRRHGLLRGIYIGLLTTILSGLWLVPMWIGQQAPPADAALQVADRPAAPELPPLPSFTDPADAPGEDSSSDSGPATSMAPAPSGLGAFLSRWEINDLCFMVLEENLRATSERVPWFVVTSSETRQHFTEQVSQWTGLEPARVAFVTTRVLSLILFAVLSLLFAWQATRTDRPQATLEAALLTLAWFWILSPTQNPWYWTWALPLVPFARNRVWLAVAGFVLIYYVRFWLLYRYGQQPVAGTTYNGTQFFDWVVVWVEHLPWLIGLTLVAGWRRWQPSTHSKETSSVVVRGT